MRNPGRRKCFPDLERLDLLKPFAVFLQKADEQLHLTPGYFAQTATAFKLKTSFVANRDGHPRAWGLPGQQRAPTLAPVGEFRGTTEDLPPSWGLSGIRSRSWSSTLPRGSVSTWAIPHASLPFFSWTYTTFITLQPSISLSGLHETGWQVQKLLEWHKHMGWLGEIGAHFVRKPHGCWLLCRGSEQRSQTGKQPKDLGVTTQKKSVFGWTWEQPNV